MTVQIGLCPKMSKNDKTSVERDSESLGTVVINVS